MPYLIGTEKNALERCLMDKFSSIDLPENLCIVDLDNDVLMISPISALDLLSRSTLSAEEIKERQKQFDRVEDLVAYVIPRIHRSRIDQKLAPFYVQYGTNRSCLSSDNINISISDRTLFNMCDYGVSDSMRSRDDCIDSSDEEIFGEELDYFDPANRDGCCWTESNPSKTKSSIKSITKERMRSSLKRSTASAVQSELTEMTAPHTESEETELTELSFTDLGDDFGDDTIDVDTCSETAVIPANILVPDVGCDVVQTPDNSRNDQSRLGSRNSKHVPNEGQILDGQFERRPLHVYDTSAPSGPANGLRKIFLSMFISLFKQYRSYLKLNKDNEIERDAANFSDFFDVGQMVQDSPPTTRDFVDAFARTQFFQYFVQTRISMRTNVGDDDDDSSMDLFDTKVKSRMERHVLNLSLLASRTQQGMLLKRGKIRKSWKRRWFDVREIEGVTTLRYFSDRAMMAQKGLLHIRPGTTRVYIPHPTDMQLDRLPTLYPFVIETSERLLLCCADTEEGRREWFKILRAKTMDREDLERMVRTYQAKLPRIANLSFVARDILDNETLIRSDEQFLLYLQSHGVWNAPLTDEQMLQKNARMSIQLPIANSAEIEQDADDHGWSSEESDDDDDDGDDRECKGGGNDEDLQSVQQQGEEGPPPHAHPVRRSRRNAFSLHRRIPETADCSKK